MNNTMSIYEAIREGLSVFDNKEARVSENKVSVDTYAVWLAYEKVAHDAFYDYVCERKKVLIAETFGEEYTADKTIENTAHAALRNLLACIGEVNGFKLRSSDDMLIDVSTVSETVVKKLAGEALTQKSIVDNLRREVNGFANGMNPDYVQAKNVEFEAAKVKLRLLKKQAGSKDTHDKEKSKFNDFRIALENEFARIVDKQENTPRAVLEARELKLKEERDAKRKANKLAKQQSK